MYEDVIDLLKAHDYFRGISGAVLGEIASLADVTNYEPAAIIHKLNDPLTAICFILRGRLKAVRVDSRGDEHLFQIFERGDQYGMMLDGLGESIPVRIFALEPSTILSLDYEKALELMLLNPELRRRCNRGATSDSRSPVSGCVPGDRELLDPPRGKTRSNVGVKQISTER